MTPVNITTAANVHFHTKNFVIFDTLSRTTRISIKSSNPSENGYGLKLVDRLNDELELHAASIEDGVTLMHMEGTIEHDVVYSEMTDRLAHFAKEHRLMESSLANVEILLALAAQRKAYVSVRRLVLDGNQADKEGVEERAKKRSKTSSDKAKARAEAGRRIALRSFSVFGQKRPCAATHLPTTSKSTRSTSCCTIAKNPGSHQGCTACPC